MKNLLVKMSRNKSLIVPVVTLVIIGIGISGYYIQNQQVLSRAEQEKTAQKENTKHSENNSNPTEAEMAETNDMGDKSVVTENGKKAEVVAVTVETKNGDGDGQIILATNVSSDKPGTCVFYLKQGNYGPEDSVKVSDGSCEAHFDKPGSGQWTVEVQFTSNDGTARGNAKTTIDL